MSAAAEQDYFFALAAALNELLRGDEIYTAYFDGEDSSFVRLNNAAVRQAGSVRQRELRLDLIEGRRHAAASLSLCGSLADDRSRLAALFERLREVRARTPEDPYLAFNREGGSSQRAAPSQLPEDGYVLDQVAAAARGRDLVGIYASGAQYSGFASSLGQRNWHAAHSYNLDWSLYAHGDKAVKGAYAGFAWEADEFAARVERAHEQLAIMAQPARTLSPGRYRAYLAPAAIWEILSMLGWGGFSLRAQRTKTTPLIAMIEGDKRMAPAIRLSEATVRGVAPDFEEAGFRRPPEVPLIAGGEYRQSLVSPRSAVEYDSVCNGATAMESPLSLEMGGGELARDRVLAELGRGIYVGNLWYLNFSDRNACRTTGMTRFATFWVEGGRIQAPLEVMRFDDTVYRMLGDNLIGLTRERERILDAGTYYRRSAHSALLPGALVDDFALTL
jgi:predicted Zn-dependent protease